MRRKEVQFASPASATLAARLGAAIRLARLARNQTQADFAERARVSRRTLIRIEAGDPAVSFTGWLSAMESASLLPLFDKAATPDADVIGRTQRESESRKRARKTPVRPGDNYDF